MNKHLIACLAAALTAMPATASATVINFDVDGSGSTIASDTPITTQYANLGVTFQGWENGQAVDISAAPDPDGITAPSAPNVLTNCAVVGTFCPSNRADVVNILFASAASGISFQLDTLGSASVTFNLYDSLNNLLETQTVTSGGSLYVPVTFSATGVSRIEGLQPYDSWAWAMDDLSFNIAGVPEPSTWATMLLGFGFVGGAMRMRRRQGKLAASRA